MDSQHCARLVDESSAVLRSSFVGALSPVMSLAILSTMSMLPRNGIAYTRFNISSQCEVMYSSPDAAHAYLHRTGAKSNSSSEVFSGLDKGAKR